MRRSHPRIPWPFCSQRRRREQPGVLITGRPSACMLAASLWQVGTTDALVAEAWFAAALSPSPGVDSGGRGEVESPTKAVQMDVQRGRRNRQGPCRRRVLSFGQVVQIEFSAGLAMLLPNMLVADFFNSAEWRAPCFAIRQSPMAPRAVVHREARWSRTNRFWRLQGALWRSFFADRARLWADLPPPIRS